MEDWETGSPFFMLLWGFEKDAYRTVRCGISQCLPQTFSNAYVVHRRRSMLRISFSSFKMPRAARIKQPSMAK
jgi:hypothetical protein